MSGYKINHSLKFNETMNNNILKPIMFVGTGSDVGKSIINTAFCRIFAQDGYSPAPYKAQNMSLNSYATPDGLEIGRAQAVQAEACGVDCSTDMNPVLLKPYGGNKSQVVLNGKPVGNVSAIDYFKNNNKEPLFVEAKAAFSRLNELYNPIVMEGAGSISELNLAHRDITNMRIAQYADAAVYLVADIDRGGVFASVYGSIMLLPDAQRKLIKGIIINKFRGDIKLFEEGKQIILDKTGVPVVGIVPYYNDIHIEEEDSVVLDKKSTELAHDKVNVAVVKLRYMSNFTDFDALEHNKNVNLFYAENPNQLNDANVIILPGSKNTISDLLFIKEKGFDQAIHNAQNKGKKIIGICGGYQMMGDEIADPYGVEGDTKAVNGLGLLSVRTVLTKEKVTKQSTFTFRNYNDNCYGYEIHMGETIVSNDMQSLNLTRENKTEGCFKNKNCWGTYMHGILDNKVVIDYILSDFNIEPDSFDYRKFKNEQYNKLANHVRQFVDVDKIYNDLKL